MIAQAFAAAKLQRRIGDQPRHQADRDDQHRGVDDQAGEAGAEELGVEWFGSAARGSNSRAKVTNEFST